MDDQKPTSNPTSRTSNSRTQSPMQHLASCLIQLLGLFNVAANTPHVTNSTPNMSRPPQKRPTPSPVKESQEAVRCKKARMIPAYDGLNPSTGAGPSPGTFIIYPFHTTIQDLTWVEVKQPSFWTSSVSPFRASQLHLATKLWVIEPEPLNVDRYDSVNGPDNEAMRSVTIDILSQMVNLTTVVLSKTSHIQYKWLLIHAKHLTSLTLGDTKEFNPVSWFENLDSAAVHWRDKGGFPLTVLRLVNLPGLSARKLAQMAHHFPWLKKFEMPSSYTRYFVHQILWLMMEFVKVTKICHFDCVPFAPRGKLLWSEVKDEEDMILKANFYWRQDFVEKIILPQMQEGPGVYVGEWLYDHFVTPGDTPADLKARFWHADCMSSMTFGQELMTAEHAPNAPVWKARPVGHKGPWHPWYGGAYNHLTAPGKEESIPGPVPEHFEMKPPCDPELWNDFVNSILGGLSSEKEEEEENEDEPSSDEEEEEWLLPPASEEAHSEVGDVAPPEKDSDVVYEDVWLPPPTDEDIHSEMSDVTHPEKDGDVV